MGGNLSPTNPGPTRTDCYHSQTGFQRFANNWPLIYKCRQIANVLQSIWVNLHWWLQLIHILPLIPLRVKEGTSREAGSTLDWSLLCHRANTESWTTTYSHIHSYTPFGISNQLNLTSVGGSHRTQKECTQKLCQHGFKPRTRETNLVLLPFHHCFDAVVWRWQLTVSGL